MPLNSVFTTHGTLLGYSDTTIIKKARKVASLLGVIWRSANQAQPSSKQDDFEGINSATLLLKVLTTIRGADGKISIMTVEIDKMIAAMCDVKESLLVAALVTAKKPSSVGDQVSERISEDDDDDDVDHTDAADVEEPSNATYNIASTEIEPLRTSSDSEQEVEEEEQQQASSTLTSSKGISEGGAEDSDSTPTPTPIPPSLSSSSSSLSSKPKPSQMQILIWRVEAMAEALRDDLRDFKMPQGIL